MTPERSSPEPEPERCDLDPADRYCHRHERHCQGVPAGWLPRVPSPESE